MAVFECLFTPCVQNFTCMLSFKTELYFSFNIKLFVDGSKNMPVTYTYVISVFKYRIWGEHLWLIWSMRPYAYGKPL